MNVSGLSTDIFFIEAIKSNEELMALLPAHDVYNNVADPDYDMDNVKMPYIIVNNDGGSNDNMSKDDRYESDEDKVNVSVRVVARNRKELDDLATTVRRTIHQYILDADDTAVGEEPVNYDLKPWDYTMSWSDIGYSMQKPCHYVVLQYSCEVLNLIENGSN